MGVWWSKDDGINGTKVGTQDKEEVSTLKIKRKIKDQVSVPVFTFFVLFPYTLLLLLVITTVTTMLLQERHINHE